MSWFRVMLWQTFRLRAFGWTKVPLLYWCMPSVTRLDDSGCTIRIPLVRRTKNHLGSMYFGALCVGADCAGGLIAYRLIQKSRIPISLIFKDFNAQFLKRAEGDVEFSCDQGAEISEFVNRVIGSSERQEMTVRIEARVTGPARPSGRKRAGGRSLTPIDPNEVIARFELTLSLKRPI